MSSGPPLYQLLQTLEKLSKLHRRAQSGRLVISRVFRTITGTQAVSYSQLLSESDLLNCGWLVVESITHWKDGFGLCLGVAKSGFNCLFNVLKTISFYFHLIKTVKLSFKYMEFTTNYHWFCSFLFCSFHFWLTPQYTTNNKALSVFVKKQNNKEQDRQRPCLRMWPVLIHIAQYAQC